MKRSVYVPEGEVGFRYQILDPFSNPMTVVFWAKTEEEATAAINKSAYSQFSKPKLVEILGNVTMERVS